MDWNSMADETNKGLLTMFLSLWQVWIVMAVTLIIMAIIKIKLPYLKGLIGEKFVSRKLFNLDLAHYKVLDDLLLPSNGNLNMTQLDHVVVSNYGIFCIETKSYKGWIFGNANDKYWTQVIYKYKERFYNPLRQNYAHIKAIEEFVKSKYPKAQILSFIIFPNAGKLKISGTDSVGYARDIVRKIENYKVQVFTDAERDEIYNTLANANIQDKELRKLHNKGVRELKMRK
ncbi:MAG: NERD domain-containing protein [Candidatus Pacebacteria bacterium]|nr:NERD domain-containing protein [Candidatus Paceibacterota bacterium]